MFKRWQKPCPGGQRGFVVTPSNPGTREMSRKCDWNKAMKNPINQQLHALGVSVLECIALVLRWSRRGLFPSRGLRGCPQGTVSHPGHGATMGVPSLPPVRGELPLPRYRCVRTTRKGERRTGGTRINVIASRADAEAELFCSEPES